MGGGEVSFAKEKKCVYIRAPLIFFIILHIPYLRMPTFLLMVRTYSAEGDLSMTIEVRTL